MTWKGVGSFPSVTINVVKNVKDYINLLLGGCFTFERVLLSTSILDYAKMCPWKVGGLSAHTGVFLVQSDTPGGVGHDHVQHKALRKIILLNTVRRIEVDIAEQVIATVGSATSQSF